MVADVGWLIVRLVVGVLSVGRGLQRLAGWFGGRGPSGTEQRMASLGLHPPRFWAMVAGLGELTGGLLLALGFLNPLGSVAIVAVMGMAAATVHRTRGIWASAGGYEYPLTNIATVVAIALAGPGGYSLDAALGVRLQVVPLLLAGLAADLIVVASAVARRRDAPERTRALQRTIQLRH